MTSLDIIEMHVSVYASLLRACGQTATADQKNAYRLSLVALVKLARNEFANQMQSDINQASAALR